MVADDLRTFELDTKRVAKLSPAWVHLALIGSYFIFGGGSLVSKIGIYGSSPVVYELVREVLTLVVLWPIALYMGSVTTPQTQHAFRVLWTGFFFFCNQACFFAGLKLADPVSAATWQASIPGFTAFVCSVLGLEDFTCRKAIGILLASLGAAALALIGGRKSGHDAPETDTVSNAYLWGHLIFFMGVMSVPGYVITMKPLVNAYSALTVTTWSFTVSAALMASTAVIVNVTPSALNLICFDEDWQVATLCRADPWRLPSNMWMPVLYEVFGCSLIGWSALAWACRHTTATIVNLYSVVQPLAAALLAQFALQLGHFAGRGIQPAGVHHLTGSTLIMIGLVLTMCDQQTTAAHVEAVKFRSKRSKDLENYRSTA